MKKGLKKMTDIQWNQSAQCKSCEHSRLGWL